MLCLNIHLIVQTHTHTHTHTYTNAHTHAQTSARAARQAKPTNDIFWGYTQSHTRQAKPCGVTNDFFDMRSNIKS